VYSLRKNLEAFGTVPRPPRPPRPLSVQGRSRKIHHDAAEALKDFLQQNKTAYQDEIAEFLASELNTYVHRTTICRLLQKLGETHKRVESAAGRDVIKSILEVTTMLVESKSTGFPGRIGSERMDKGSKSHSPP
jgi:hypothetical protein